MLETRLVLVGRVLNVLSVILKAGILTDEAVRNGALKRKTKERGNSREPSRDGNVRDDNNRSRIRSAFAIITNPDRKQYNDTTPKCLNCNFHHSPETPCRSCMNCNRLGHFSKDCRAGLRMVNPLNARNPTGARGACFECA
nr:hypothetical protein [Tanacetum cinerariifolium]